MASESNNDLKSSGIQVISSSGTGILNLQSLSSVCDWQKYFCINTKLCILQKFVSF